MLNNIRTFIEVNLRNTKWMLTCIDLISRPKAPKSFKSTNFVETGLSDLRKITVAVIKPHYARESPEMMYRDFKNLFNDSLKTEILYAVDGNQSHNQ